MICSSGWARPLFTLIHFSSLTYTPASEAFPSSLPPFLHFPQDCIHTSEAYFPQGNDKHPPRTLDGSNAPATDQGP